MNYTNVIIILVLIIVTVVWLRRDKAQYEKFKSLRKTEDRQAYFKKWTIESFLFYGLTSIIILLLIGQISSLYRMPDFLVELINAFNSNEIINNNQELSDFLEGLSTVLFPALLIGPTIVTIISESFPSDSKSSDKSDNSAKTDFRNLNALIPKNYQERIWGALLSFNAGISEEIFFRLLLPILIYSISGSILFAIFGSTIWFGLVHSYQGLSGIIATFFLGLLLLAIYLITQNIWLTILVHIVIDLNGLVLGPWLKEKYNKHKTTG